MPTGQRGWKPASSISTPTPTASQAQFSPRKCTVRPRGPTWSAPSRRQQTITQMDPFHSFYHPEEEEEDLQYEDVVANTHESPPKGAKRRKIDPMVTPVHKALTRSARKQAAKSAPQTRAFRLKEEVHVDEKAEKPNHLDSAELMPPPKTPKSTRKKEIPSSQSPADTPLSTQSRKSVREVSRSPLKEKSMNIASRRSSAKKNIKWAELKEVTDRMETEVKDSPMKPFKSRGEMGSRTAEQIYEELMAMSSDREAPVDAVSRSIAGEHADLSSAGEVGDSQEDATASQIRPKTVIFDSDEEGEWGEGDSAEGGGNEGREALGARIETLHNFSTATPPLSQPQSTSRRPAPRSTKPNVDVPSSQPDSNARNYSSACIHDPCTQDLASDQLHSELHRSTQAAGALVTESQNENVWASYYPEGASDLNSSPPLQLLSSGPKELQESSPASMTVPTQPLPVSSKWNGVSPYKREVPPSQATTVDTTQSSPHRARFPSQIQVPSSPPLEPAALLSSPLLSRRGVSQATARAYEWDGRVLTDSQLLPASLMDDSIAGPPRCGIEGLEEEV